jgi:hypothetical protein
MNPKIFCSLDFSFGSFLLEEQKNRGAQLRDELGNAK